MRWMMAAVVVMSGCEVPRPPPAKLLVSAGSLKLECPRHSVKAYDASRSLLPGSALSCRASLADRAGAPLVGAELSLLTEAGRLIASGPADADGVIELTHQVAMPTPLDVEPQSFPLHAQIDELHTGQPLAPAWMRPELWMDFPSLALVRPTALRTEPRRPDPIRLKADGTGRFVNNPRDNLVTLVGFVAGEEGFTDSNGNGLPDADEAFEDLTEPFVDADDDGTWDQGEAFVDANDNGQWDGKNGRWDAQTLLWVQERVLWTGEPAPQDFAAAVVGVIGQKQTMAQFPATLVCRTSTSACASAVDQQTGLPGMFRFYISDPWFNSMARPGPEAPCVMGPQVGTPLVTFGPVITDVDGTLDAPAGWSGSVVITDVRDPTNPGANRPRGLPQTINGSLRCQVSSGEVQLTVSFATIE